MGEGEKAEIVKLITDSFDRIDSRLEKFEDKVEKKIENLDRKFASAQVCELKHSSVNARLRNLEEKEKSDSHAALQAVRGGSDMKSVVKIISIVIGALTAIVGSIVVIVKTLAN
jgi:hypothetical protein